MRSSVRSTCSNATIATRSRSAHGLSLGSRTDLRQFAREGLKLACVTNKAESFTLPLLEATGLRGFFDLVVAGDSSARKKPDPLPLLHLRTAVRCAGPMSCWWSETRRTTRAARAAGCPAFCVPYGYSARDVRELDCDAIVGDLVEACKADYPDTVVIRETVNTGRIWLLAAGSWRYWRPLTVCCARNLKS